ncbi:MAG TPA: cysteine-rich KTR domain-containing protein [Candidatus Eubacterium faecipullorum]|uniref:Cysteine-rich KTR domain-containing protein n=1 Tax=Candidatus Eubacterium faecipullorum TaxID=2838571 RepID=A0A9D1UFY4_9FIRM|nr:cysteine-rich KTR domain-containing protein [Candidatus Eubacterium faecipullorum]
MRIEWLLCPICKSKTRLQLREDTELKNFPLYCPKCKQETCANSSCRSGNFLSPKLPVTLA